MGGVFDPPRQDIAQLGGAEISVVVSGDSGVDFLPETSLDIPTGWYFQCRTPRRITGPFRDLYNDAVGERKFYAGNGRLILWH